MNLLIFRLLIELAVAAAIVAGTSPGRPGIAALGCSLLAGGALAMVLAARIPRLADVRRTGRRYFVSGAFVSLKAFAEEALWRGLVFGVALPRLGLPVAALLSILGFVAVHVPGQREMAVTHVITGATFLICYAAGGLWSAVAAHAAYNVIFLTLHSASRAQARVPA